MNERERQFLEQHHAAAMITLRSDGTPHVVRVGVALFDGKLWSSGIPSRVRTVHLRHDPRAAFFVFDPSGSNPFPWLGLEGTVTILDGPDAAEKSVRLFQAMQAGLSRRPSPGHLFWDGEEKSEEEFLLIMEKQRRLIYEFEITRTYGLD